MTSRIIVLSIALFSLCTVSDTQIERQLLEDVFGYQSSTKNNFNESMDWLSLTLTKRIASSSKHNFLLSPLGLKLALCSLAAAASNNTRSQLLSVLDSDLDVSIRNKYTKIASSLKEKSPLFLQNLGSQIFVPDGLLPGQKPVFRSEDTYNTELRTVDIRDPFEVAKEINSKNLKITEGKISNSFNEYDVPNMRMLVLNTFYFKSAWNHPFEPDIIGDYTYNFYVNPETVKSISFMRAIDIFKYAESEKLDAKILEVPYVGGHVIYFIVPNSVTGLPRVLDNLSLFETELNKLKSQYVDVVLPPFQLDYTSRVNGILKELGVQEAFQDSALFPGIGRNTLQNERLKISSVMQRLHFEINEYGSDVYSHPDDSRFAVNRTVDIFANRPFLFLLQDKITGQLLLIGRITDPTIAESYFEIV